MQYQHTQYGPLHSIFAVSATILFIIAWQNPVNALLTNSLIAIAILSLTLAFSFRSLTIADQGDRLKITFGPLPLFRKSIPYTHITSVEAGQSTLVDGWGIHYIPGRGWTYNLWGYDCALVRQGKKVIRIGTDDLENLIEFLNQKIK